MDLYLDQDAFAKAKEELARYIGSEGLEGLAKKITASLDQLKKDWDSEAGRAFFNRFESDLISNLDKYAKVFEHINQNLVTASHMYEEVFREAEAVKNTALSE